jgi:ubiquinone/menaquinone biosynthesis C-methylase UbiE
MSDNDTRVSDLWSDFAAKRAAPGHLAWMFAMDHPRIRNRLYARYLNGLDPMSYVKRLLPTPPVASALEIGCGGGDLALAVKSMGMATHIDAFDVAAGAIELARSKARAAEVEGLNFFVADAGSLPLQTASYDFVYASHSLHHIEKLESMFESVHRAMKPGALFFADDYIGPSRMQYSDGQLELVNALLTSLPESKRVNKLSNNTVKTHVERTPIETYLAIDPSEGVRAAEIVSVMSRWFDVEVIPTGMSLLYEVFLGIVHNFDPDNEQDNALVDLMLVADEMCSANRVVEPCFACLLGRPKALGR